MSDQVNQSEGAKKTYTYQDLVKFSNVNVYSGFGEVKDSKKPSAPKFSFGTSTRAAGPKKYENKDMARIDCFGKMFLTKANKLPRDLITTSMISFPIKRDLSGRWALNPGIHLTPRPSTTTTSERM